MNAGALGSRSTLPSKLSVARAPESAREFRGWTASDQENVAYVFLPPKSERTRTSFYRKDVVCQRLNVFPPLTPHARSLSSYGI